LFCSSLYADEEVVEIAVEEGDYLIKLGEEYLEYPHRWREGAHINNLKNPAENLRESS